MKKMTARVKNIVKEAGEIIIVIKLAKAISKNRAESPKSMSALGILDSAGNFATSLPPSV